MDQIFARLSVALEGSALIALFAALAWGVLSVILSPCHLATIPLIVAFVGGGSVGQPRRRAIVLSGAFAGGMFIALAAVGVLFAFVGHALVGVLEVDRHYLFAATMRSRAGTWSATGTTPPGSISSAAWTSAFAWARASYGARCTATLRPACLIVRPTEGVFPTVPVSIAMMLPGLTSRSVRTGCIMPPV